MDCGLWRRDWFIDELKELSQVWKGDAGVRALAEYAPVVEEAKGPRW